MKNKIIQSIPALITLVFTGFRYFSTWCISSVPSCYGSLVHQSYQYITYPLFLFSLFFLPFAIILIFIPRHVFKSWLKFAAWMIPLLLILVATQPVTVTHILETNRDDAARLAGQVFTVLSLILIIWKYFVARRSTN